MMAYGPLEWARGTTLAVTGIPRQLREEVQMLVQEAGGRCDLVMV